jgi:hypothetical protein
MPSRFRDASVAIVVALLLAALLTWPLVARLGSAGRIDSGDGRHGVWNVAWVAHALTSDPTSLFNANIFHPHRQTLAYSEANMVAGLVATPVYLLTGNPIASYNAVVLLAFAAAALSAFLLVRVLGGSRLGAAIAGLAYGFSPYMFAHLAHIQLLMTFGPALSLAAMHHFTKAPSLRRGAQLGAALALTGLACAYYGIFAALATGIGLVWNLATDRRLRDAQFWMGITAAVTVVVLVVGPFFVPYLSVREAGFERSLAEARLNSTGGTAYLASAVLVHRWMLPLLGQWQEVLFPGFAAVILAVLGVVVAARSPGLKPGGSIIGLYVAIGALAFWASLGPDAGLYLWMYKVVPAFSFLRAPVRFGVLVLLVIAVLAGLAVTWLERQRWKAWPAIAAALLAIGLVESYVGPLQLASAPRVHEAHRQLTILPRGPVAEFPFFARERHRHTEYMLASTLHWQPLINGYSDHIPADFFESLPALEAFPSPDSWTVLRAKEVRWIVVHFDSYPPEVAAVLRPQLLAMTDRLRVVVDAHPVSLYEVIWPRPQSAVQRP